MLPVLFSQLLFLWPRARRGEWDMAASLSGRSTVSHTASLPRTWRANALKPSPWVGLNPKPLQIEPVAFLWETFGSGQKTEVWPRGQ